MNSGTIFSVTPTGTETVLYNFKGAPDDGSGPLAGLSYNGGRFYGTTNSGGALNQGTVFAFSVTNSETVLYSFAGGKDGENPQASIA